MHRSTSDRVFVLLVDGIVRLVDLPSGSLAMTVELRSTPPLTLSSAGKQETENSVCLCQ